MKKNRNSKTLDTVERGSLNKKGKNRILIIITILIVCMLVLIGVIYYINVNNKEIDKVEQAKEQLSSTENFISTKDHLAQMAQSSSGGGITVLTTDDLTFEFESKSGNHTYSITDWSIRQASGYYTQNGNNINSVIISNEYIDLKDSTKLFIRINTASTYSSSWNPTIAIVDSEGTVTTLGAKASIPSNYTFLEWYDVSEYDGQYRLKITLPGPRHTTGYSESLTYNLSDIMFD